MAKLTKNERVVQLLVELFKRPKSTFSVNDLLRKLELPENERRKVQRDMKTLVDLQSNLVICEGRGPNKRYRTGLDVLDKLAFPDFENVMLQFVFLQNITDIYPGTADLIENLQNEILRNLPRSQQDKLKNVRKEIENKVFFMGMPPRIDDDAGERLHTILEAIRTHHEVITRYKPTEGKQNKEPRFPVGIVLFQGEIYIACARHRDPRSIYTMKFNRIGSVEWSAKTFNEYFESLEVLKSRVDDFSLFNSQKQGVEKVHLTFPLNKRAYIEERRFHHSMKITERKGLLHVTMKVNISFQLKQWLLFHTENGVEVLEPKHLRDELREIGLGIVEKYR